MNWIHQHPATIDSCDLLNQLVRMHAQSLATYLADATPSDAERLPQHMQVLRTIAQDHRHVVDTVADEIIRRHGRVERGSFPMSFTALNDLSLRFLVTRLEAQQRSDISTLETMVESLRHDSRAQALAEDALGAAIGHLDSLLDLQREP